MIPVSSFALLILPKDQQFAHPGLKLTETFTKSVFSVLYTAAKNLSIIEAGVTGLALERGQGRWRHPGSPEKSSALKQ